MTDPADPEGAAPALRVTYSTATTAPRTVYVVGEAPTDADVAEAVRKDLAERTDKGAGTLEV